MGIISEIRELHNYTNLPHNISTAVLIDRKTDKYTKKHTNR